MEHLEKVVDMKLNIRNVESYVFLLVKENSEGKFLQH